MKRAKIWIKKCNSSLGLSLLATKGRKNFEYEEKGKNLDQKDVR